MPCRLGRDCFSCKGDAGCCLCEVDEEVLCGILYGVVADEAHRPGEEDVPRHSVIYAVVQVIEAGLKFGIVLWPNVSSKIVHSELDPKA